jgi:hypothetical protein
VLETIRPCNRCDQGTGEPGDDIYVRAAHRHDNPLFQRARKSGEGRVRAGGVECDIAFEEPGVEQPAG